MMTERMSGVARSSRWGWTALAGLVCVFFWKLAFSREYVWFDQPDMCYLEIPRLGFMAREMHNGRFPLWDPSIWAGQSMAGQAQPGALYPLNFLYLMLPLEGGYLRWTYLNWYWVFIHVLGAWGVYALSRAWGRSVWAAMLAGLAFGCGGFLGTVAWLDVANGAVWAGWIFYFLTRSLDGDRRYGAAAMSGLCLGMAWLSGHHEMPLLLTIAAVTAWMWAALRDRQVAIAGALSFAVTGLVSFMQVAPLMEFGRLAKRWVGVADPVGWKDAVPYYAPTVYSLPGRGLLETVIPSGNRYADCAPFLGAAVVALAVLGMGAYWRERRVRFALLAVAVSAVWAMGAGTPLHGALFNLVPGLDKARIPVRAILIFNLGLSVLAAFGLDALLSRDYGRWVKRVGWGLAVLGIAVSGWAIGDREMDDRVIRTGVMAFGLAGAMAAYQKEKLGQWAMVAVVVVMAMAEMHGVSTATYSARFAEGQMRFVKMLEGDGDVADYLRREQLREPVRISVNENDVPVNFGDWHGVDALQGYAAGVPASLLWAELHTPRAQQIFAVTHHVAKDAPGMTSVFEGRSGLKVFRVEEARPRTWSVHEAFAARDENELWTMVQQKLDLRKQTSILGEAPQLERCDGDVVNLASYGASRIRLRAKMVCAGMVVLGDAYYPGWEARVDGAPVRIWEAYGAARGVVVAAGEHEVEFRFRPKAVLYVAWMFGFGLLLSCGLWVSKR